jgi:hypothetical protein
MDKATKLHAYLDSMAGEPFRWGINDCCLFAANWIRELRGVDPYKDYRGKYETALGAARLIKQGGGLDQASCVKMAEAGFKEVNPNFAQRGDVCLVSGADERIFCGIIVPGGVAIPSEHGYLISNRVVIKAWRV